MVLNGGAHRTPARGNFGGCLAGIVAMLFLASVALYVWSTR